MRSRRSIKNLSLIMAIVLGITLSGCGNSQIREDKGSSSGETQSTTVGQPQTEHDDQSAQENSGIIIIKAAVTAPVEGAHSLALFKMKEAIEEYTDGAVDFQVYTNGQLGGEREIVEGVSIGTIECGVVSTGPLPNFVQDFMVLDLPYLIKDRTKAFQIMDGEIGQSMLDKLDTIGIKGMSFWDNGYRYITSSRPVVHPEDVKGMKIRTMENEVHMNTFKLLGATPTPMAISEFLTAVRQGTVDGHENVMVSIDMNKVYEVNPCISLTKHFYSAAPFLVNADFYQSLPDDIRQAFDRAEKEAMEWERQYCDELDNELIEKMKGLGAEFYEVDIDEWARATQGVYDLYEDKIDQALIDAFRNED